MERIERYIRDVCRGLHVAQPLRGQLAEELRAHLLESVQARVDDGMPEAEAVTAALSEFGSADAVHDELKAAYGGNLLTLLVQRAMDWREQTMKTDWKWGFAAQVGLLLVLVVGYAALMFWVRFLVPEMANAYGNLSTTLPSIYAAGLRFVRFFDKTWLLWPALFGVAWAVFEWRCRSESKAAIRMAATAWATLVVVAVACVFATATMAMSADLLVQSAH